MRQIPGKLYVLSIYVVLALVTIIAFEPVRHNDFVNFDDDEYVTENLRVNGRITLDSVVWAFTTPHGANWHPLTWLSHMLDCHLFGLNPFWHHLTNLVFHIANTLLLFGVLKRMTGALWPSAFVAAAFALHPLHVESVAWVAERKDVLSGFFWMLTMLAYVRYAERPDIEKYLLVVLALCLGLMAKPMLVTLPFVLLLLDYWPLRRFQWEHQSRKKTLSQPPISIAGHRTSACRLFAEKIPLFILVAASSIVTYMVQQSGGAVVQTETLPLNTRIANTFVSYLSYIIKMVCPTSLAVLYPYPLDKLLSWQPMVSLLILALVSAGIIYTARQRRYLAVGWLWYLGTLVPVIGLVQVGGQAIADRYTYLPSIGVFIMVAWGAAGLAAKWRFQKFCLGISAGIVLVTLLICTRIQVRHWKNSFTLFEHALEVTKNNSIIHNNFGDALRKQGRFNEAIKHFDKALQINPRYYAANHNKAVVFLELGKIDEAIAIFTEVLCTRKDWFEAYNNLGLAYAQKGKFDLAVKNYNETLRLKPGYVKAINNLGAALKEQGKINEAIEKWEKALQLEPRHPNARYNLALAMAQQGKYENAVKHFNKTLEVKPDWPAAHYNLGCAYYHQGKFDLAIKQYSEALRLKPDYLKASIDLANTLLKLGQTQPALEHYYKMLELKPDQAELLNDLAWILATTKDTKLQNPTQAVEFARKACESTRYEKPSLLDTLAAAYAAAGRFSEAVTTAEKALQLAQSSQQKKLAEEIRNRLRLYKAGQPYIELSPKAFSD